MTLFSETRGSWRGLWHDDRIAYYYIEGSGGMAVRLLTVLYVQRKGHQFLHCLLER